MNMESRQKRRQFQRKLQNPNYKQGYIDGVEKAITTFEKAMNDLKWIGDKRKMEIQEQLNSFFKSIAEGERA